MSTCTTVTAPSHDRERAGFTKLTYMTTDRPSPRADRAQTFGLSQTTNKTAFRFRSRSLCRSICHLLSRKALSFHFGKAKHIVPIIYFNLCDSKVLHASLRQFQWRGPSQDRGNLSPDSVTPKLLFANCSSFTWAGNGEARLVGDR